MSRARHIFPGSWMRGRKMRASIGVGMALVFAVACGVAARSQQSGPGAVNGGGNGSGNSSMRQQRPDMSSMSPFDDSDDSMMQRHLLALNIERQKEMVSDTNKLLKLARELNEEVAASQATSFTPDQMRKIVEIEKLAKNVRERMTSAVGPQQQTPYLNIPYGMTPGIH